MKEEPAQERLRPLAAKQFRQAKYLVSAGISFDIQLSSCTLVIGYDTLTPKVK